MGLSTPPQQNSPDLHILELVTSLFPATKKDYSSNILPYCLHCYSCLSAICQIVFLKALLTHSLHCASVPGILLATLLAIFVISEAVAFLTHIIIEQIARNKEQMENASDFDKDGYTKR
jgi:predicted neutral ceramidase superfamily lipid hydrolase